MVNNEIVGGSQTGGKRDVDFDPFKVEPGSMADKMKVRRLSPTGAGVGIGGTPLTEYEKQMLAQASFEGMDLAQAIRSVELGQLGAVLTEATAFEMGLEFGARGWDLNEEYDISLLMQKFSTGEGMMDRPYSLYVEQATNARIQAEVRRLMGIRNPEAAKLKGRYGNIEARRWVDKAFLQRTNTCQNEDTVADLIKNGGQQITPDKATWNLLFRGDEEYGKLMDKALRAIVEVAYVPDERYPMGDRENVPGISVSIYSKGFEDTDMFALWLKHVLKRCNNRMDVAWDAWKTALLWELPSQLATTDPKKGSVEIAPPSVGNALFSYTANWDAKTRLEFGQKINGSLTGQIEKYVSHSGLPLMLGKIPDLLQSYLHETEVENEEGEKKNLFDIWYTDGVSFADTKFPWLATEIQQDPEAKANGEPPSGSFGGWRLAMFRANTVRKDLLNIVPTSELGKPTFFSERVRVWAKILGKIKEEISSADNPRVWWVMAQILYKTTGSSYSPKVFKENPDADFRSTIPDQILHQTEEGVSSRKVSVGDVLASAKKCGFLREKDATYILDQLSMKLAGRDY